MMKLRIERAGAGGWYQRGWFMHHPDPRLTEWVPTWRAALDLAQHFARKAL